MRILLFLLFPVFASSQTCIYLAYDGFDYAPALPLDDLNGGAGWAEPWLTQNDDQILPGYQSSAGAGSLGYGNLQTAGRFASGGRVYLTAGRRLNTNPDGPFANYVADFDNGIGTEQGGELWMSTVLQKTLDNNQSVFAGLHGSSLPWCDNCSSDKIEFGYFGANSEIAGQRRWTLRVGDNYYLSSVPVSIGSPAFFVVKLLFSAANTQVELYVNPAALGNVTPTPNLTQTTAAPLVLRSAVTYLGNVPGNGAVDEIRLASTYPCVAPDNTISIDLPPVAVISVSSNDGQAPFTVHFSGANSFDPEGGQLNYAWRFGDGSPGASGPAASHTYTALGNLVARLTVTDPAGLEHTDIYPITVRNSNGTFPCLSSFSMPQQANCSGQGGIIRINDYPTTFSLKNAAGTTLTPTNNSEYHNLPAGQYTYTASSQAGCADNFELHVSIDSNTCNGWQPAICDMAIGSNLSGFADWVPERPLRNLLKHARPEPIAFNDNCFCWDNGNLPLMALTADGYPTHIPQTIAGQPNKLRYVISSNGANLPPGQSYVLLYDGTGTLQVAGGATETSNAPGRIQFNVTAAENMFFVIHASNQGNPVRNVRILRLSDEFADLEAQPFYEGFLDKIAPFKALRFMDWGATNHNPAVHWSERTPVSHFTYGTPQGVPYELMIQLANQTQKDVWVCVPHAADSNYVAQMAAMFRDQLDPKRTIYLEYSNEVWNWIFAQAHFNADNAPSNLNYGRAMAERAGRTFRIWHEVFGSATSRVKRVLGLQASFNYLNEQILSQLSPDEWDYGSPTSYIGLDHSENGNPVLTPASTPADIIQNARSSWANFRPALWQDYNNIKLFGKQIINYEGGQHFVGNVFGIPYAYQQAMWDAQYSPEIYALYDEMLDTIRNWGSRLFGNFSLSSPQESVYGSWGVLNDIDVSPPYFLHAPKYQALLDNLCLNPSSDSDEPALSNRSAWLLAPNPTNGLVWALGNGEASYRELNIRVYDMYGRQMRQQLVGQLENTSQDAVKIPLDLSGLHPGIYQVSITSEGHLWTGLVLVLE